MKSEFSQTEKNPLLIYAQNVGLKELLEKKNKKNDLVSISFIKITTNIFNEKFVFENDYSLINC